MTKKQKKAKQEKKATLFVADESVDNEDDASSDAEDQDNENDHLYELIRGVPTVVIRCLETTDDYIPVPQDNESTSNVVVKLKPATRVPKFTISLPTSIRASSSSCKYLPRDSKNTDEKDCDQSKIKQNKNGVRGCLNFDSDENSEKDEEFGSDEKDEKLETDRFDQKGGKRVKTDRFGRNAGGKSDQSQEIIMDLKMRAASAEQKLKRSEKLNSSIKTAIRKIVSVKRDIKSSLATLTDANDSLPRVRKAEE
jgi:hypothetical protein